MRKFFNAFTLSEVLITLGVIGVVAAITLPTLIQNYNKKVWTTSLKKAYSTASQACNLAMAKEGVNDLTQTDFFNAIFNYNFDNQKTEFFTNAIVKNDISMKNLEYKNLAGNINTSRLPSRAVSVELPASTFYINATHFFGHESIVFYVDVNGYNKRPNKAGADFFLFALDKNGKLIAAESTGGCTSEVPHVEANSNDCFNKVLQDDWEIKYDIKF